MANKEVKAKNAPAAIGPYSQAIQSGNTIYVSGQLAFDPATGEIIGDNAKAQTKQSLTNIKNILEAAGYSMSDVVKTTVLLKDIADFSDMNEVYGTFFTEPYPARIAYQVGALPRNGLVEVEVIAVKE